MLQINQITIIGTGLLGASIGLGLKAAGFSGRIVGVGRREHTLNIARQRGAIDEGTCDLAAAARHAQLALIAVPLGNFDAVLGDLARCDHDGLTVTDVGSTKGSVVAAANRLLPDPSRFCGSHPMAGNEQQGPDAAEPTLFRGKPCVLTPDDTTSPATLHMVQSLWQTLNMRLLRMTAAEHDRKTAVISHLPHALAALLMQVVADSGGLEVASTGLRDTSRLASSNPPMRADILAANRAAVLDALDGFGRRLDGLRHALAAGQDDAVLAVLQQAKATRDTWLATADAADDGQGPGPVAANLYEEA